MKSVQPTLDLFIKKPAITYKPLTRTLNVVDLFAGVGGLSYGFAHNDNFKILLANEYEPHIAQAYSLNHPDVKMLNCDIRDITEDQLKEHITEPIDIIVGGPPCQSYSTLGKRKMDDRAHLFQEYYRILSIIKPKLFIFENVSGIMSMQSGALIKHIIAKFNELGYDVKSKLLNAVDYGVPQFRDRVILVGTLGKNSFEYPQPTHGDQLLPHRTVKDAISDLPILQSGGQSSSYASEPLNDYQRMLRDNGNVLTENDAPKNGEHLVQLMKALPDGGSKDDLPPELRPKSGYGNTYAKMWWEKPAPTVTRNFATPSSSRCVHPRDSRAMTTREGARLQSFPDSYKFYGSRSMKNLEIGNAVPPLLSIAIAKQVEELFRRLDDE